MKQLLNLIRKANKARVTDKTHYNERSSRSHCIYRINISFNGEKDKEGVLNIVDLAGSERSSIDELSNEKDKEKVNFSLFFSIFLYFSLFFSLFIKKYK